MAEVLGAISRFYQLIDHAREATHIEGYDKSTNPLPVDEFVSYVNKFYSTGSPQTTYSNPLFIMIESKTIADLATKAYSVISGHTDASNTVVKMVDGSTIPILAKFSEVEVESSQVTRDSKEYTNEDHAGSAIAQYITGLNYSQIISLELQSAAKELKKSGTNKSNLSNTLNSIADKVKNTLLNLPGRIKESAQNLYASTQNMISSVVSGTKEKLIGLLKKIAEVLFEFMSSMIGAFFSLLSLIQQIGADKGFKMDKINLEIEAFELDTFMAGPIPLIYPKLKTPKLSIDFMAK